MADAAPEGKRGMILKRGFIGLVAVIVSFQPAAEVFAQLKATVETPARK